MNWLFGLGESAGGDVEEWTLRWINADTKMQKLIFVLAALAVIALISHFYRKEPQYVRRRKKIFLGVMRFLGCAVILTILAGPVMEVVKSDVVKSSVVIMFDQSDSMNFDDRRVEAEQIALAAKAVGRLRMTDQAVRLSDADRKDLARIKRIDVVKGLMANKELDLIKRLEERFRVEYYGFDSGIRPVAPRSMEDAGGPIGELEAAGLTTNVGTSLRELVKKMKGRQIAGVVLLTDGGSNKGEDPIITSEEIGIPIYPVGVGLPEAKDIQISYIFAEDVVFVEDRVPIFVRVKHKGYEGRSATLKLLRRKQGSAAGGEAVTEKEITFSELGEQTEILHMTPTQTGTFSFVAQIDPRPEEMISENNSRSKDIKIIDEKIKVLVVEGPPRWEFRYLQNAMRRDKRVELKTMQRSADPEVAMPGSNYIKHFPSEREEFFQFDLIILGNVAQEFFTETDLEMMYDFVEADGGSILFIPGKNNMPDTYEDITFTPEGKDVEVRFLDLLPVAIEPQPTVSGRDQMASAPPEPFKLKLSAEGREHTITRLDIDPDVNAEQWERMPEVYWYYEAIALKPAASALVVHDSERTQSGQPMPVVAVQRFGRGRTMYVGTDEIWTWRYKPGPEQYRRFWGQAVQYLAMAHLLGESKRIQLNTDQKTYAVGDKAKITARVLDPSYSPMTSETVIAQVHAGEAESHNVTLNLVHGTPGMYKGEYQTQGQGPHRLTLRNAEEEAELDFDVVIPRIEFDNPGMKWELLGEIAGRSGGQAYRVDGLAKLAESIDQRRQKTKIRLEDPLWDAPIMVILFTLFFGIEWFVRKRADLC